MELTRNASAVLGSASRLFTGARDALRHRNGRGDVPSQYAMALATDNAYSSLFRTVREDLHERGADRESVIAALDQLRLELRECGRQDDEEAVSDVLDAVYGFAPARSRL